MSLDIQLFKKGFDIHKNKANRDDAYKKLQVVKEELEQLEGEYEESKLSSHNITHNLNTMAKAALKNCLENPDAVIEVIK
jgi:hypothetical protein